jgi:hypothetical protein
MTKGFKLSPDEVDQAGSHVQNLGSKLDQHATNVASTHQKISASSRSDKSSVGKIFTSFASKSGAAFSDGFKGLSRWSKEAGDRLKIGSKRTKQTESDVQGSFTKIKAPSEDPKARPNTTDPSGPSGHTETSSAAPPRPATPPKPNTETQTKIDDHQQKANAHKDDADADFWSDDEKNRFGKAQGYHQNAADHYQNGQHDQAQNNATAAGHQEHAIKLHDDAMDSAGKQHQHQTQAADHYEQAAQHSANGQHDAANAHASAGAHHEQAAQHVGKQQYGPADRHQVGARHDGLAADHFNEAGKLPPDDPAGQAHNAAATHHQQAADHFANNRPEQGHNSAAQANSHAANAYGQQGNQAMADHHQGLANNHQNASNHLNQADQHQQEYNAAQQQHDDPARLQAQQNQWKQQQLAAHQNGIAHNTHQQTVQQNAGNTEQANHHGQAVAHHQQQQQQLQNYQPQTPPSHTPADPHTATSVPYQPTAGNPHVYRWDDRPPASAFNQGITPQVASSDHSLYTHTLGNTPTHYLSTSGDPSFQWPKQNRYVISPPAGTQDANATLGTHSPYPHQTEATVPGNISPGNIVAAENPTTGEVEFPRRGGRL